MAQLFIFDRNETLVAVLDQENKGACSHWGGNIKRVLNGEHTLTFSVDLSHPDAQKIEEYGYVAYENKYSQWELYLITELTQHHTSTLTMDVSCEASYTELDGVLIESQSHNGENTATALPAILQGTRWEVGQMYTKIGTAFDLTNVSVLSALQTYRDSFNVELNFYVEIVGGKIAHRYVDVFESMGSWKGKRFEWTKDLTEVDRVINVQNLKTALKGVGTAQTIVPTATTDPIDTTPTDTTPPPPMDFVDVVWSKANGDPADKPSGQNWVGDPNALAIYGKPLNGGTVKQHIMGVYNDSGAKTPEDLLTFTWLQLQTVNTPRITYTMKTIDLFEILGVQGEAVYLGDTVAVIDRDLNLEVQARVIELDEDVDYPEKDTCVLGNFQPYYTGIAKQNNVMEQITEQVNKTGKLDPLWVDTEFTLARDAIRSGNGTVIISQGDGILIVDDPNNPQKAIRLLGGELALANSRDATTGEFNWRAFGTGDGFLADLVETGFLRFDRSQGGTLTLGGEISGYEDINTVNQINFVGKANGDGDNTRRIFYSNSATTEIVPTTEVNAGYASSQDQGDGLFMYQTIANTNKFAPFRYIRDWLNGNTVNANNYWNDVSCFSGGTAGTNYCAGKTPTISSGTLTNPANITDGSLSTYGYEASGNGVAKNIMIDLGASHSDIDTIRIAHFYADNRTFHATKTEISNDGVTWTTIFDSAVSGEYLEPTAGTGKIYTQTNSGSPVGTLVQFMFQFVVDRTNLRDLSFQIYGKQAQPFTLRPWNYSEGLWDNSQTVTYDGSTADPVSWETLDFADYVAMDGTVRFSVLSNPLTANTTLQLSIDYAELDATEYVQTVPVYQNGTLNIEDSDGHTIATLSGDNRGFDNLWVGTISGNNVVTWLNPNNGDPLTYYVDPTHGDDGADGITTSTPLKTLQRAISKLPQVIHDYAYIRVLGTDQTWTEHISIRGFSGAGSIRFELNARNIIKGNWIIEKNMPEINIRTFQESETTSANVGTDRAQLVSPEGANTNNGNSTVNIFANNYCYLYDIVVNANNIQNYGISANYDSYVIMQNIEVYNAKDSSFYAYFGCRADIIDCSGSAPHGFSAQGSCLIGGWGRGFYAQTAGTEKNIGNGAIANPTWTYDAGVQKPLYAGATVTQWTANDIKSLFPPTHWDTYGSWIYLMTGLRNSTEKPWYGVAFFNNRDFSVLKNADGTNRNITRVRLLAQRYNGYGTNTPIKPKVWWNAQTSGSGNPGPTISTLHDGTTSDSGFLWGEQKWIDLPVSFGQAFQNGSAKSIVFYNGADEANYGRFQAKATLEITHG